MSNVIDTNVLIVANGKSEHSSIECELKCIEFINFSMSERVALDESQLIMDEYQKHCCYSGAPGVGDIFFKYLYDHQYSSKLIRLVNIVKIDDEARSFEQLPVNELDPSDRKFLATAVEANANIVNATDSDWQEQEELMNLLKVTVSQICSDCNGV